MFSLRATAGAVIALVLSGCVEPIASSNVCGDLRFASPVLVLETEYAGATSALGRLGKDGCLTEVADIAIPHNAILRSAHGRPFVLDDDSGVLYAIRSDSLSISGKFAAFQTSPDERPNPHDVDVDAAGRLWVTRFEMGSLALIEPDGAWGGEVDLSDLDPDGVPDMDAIWIVDGRAYVSLELLDRTGVPWLPRQKGRIAVVEAAPPQRRISVIDLSGSNPSGRFVPLNEAGTRVAVATPGNFSSIDASDGIDAIDLTTGLASQIVSETALGGSVWEFAVASPTEAYALVLGPVDPNPVTVVAWNPATGEVNQEPLFSRPAFDSAGIAVVGDMLLIGEFKPGAAKIHVFGRKEGAEIGAITPKLMAPWSLLPL
jgi:hypothetical protein